jgi:hypothetical protein
MMKNTTYTIRTMKRRDDGMIELGGDIAADLLADENGMPEAGDPLQEALGEIGYALDNSGDYVGWGDVYWHTGTGEMLSVQDA